MVTAPDIPLELMNPLEERIGYKFRNSLLLAEALTHPSISLERKDYPFDNQRLEFLGDAVLQLVVTDQLYRIFPDFPEGTLTKLRSRLVSRTGLKNHAVRIGIGQYMMMGRGEEANGGRIRATLLADAFEALVGAIYLDSGITKAKSFILREMSPEIEELAKRPVDINPKGELQEILQSLSPSAPYYELVSQTGPDHHKHFECRVLWEGMTLGLGGGGSKKEAEVVAASAALEKQLWKKVRPSKIPHSS